MSNRDRFRAVAEENLRIFQDGFYEASNGDLVDLSAHLQASIKQTEHLTDSAEPATIQTTPIITTADETTVAAVLRLTEQGYDNIAILNFASATTPGGGFLRGGNAQEEALCRASILYPALENQTAFYTANADAKDPVYQDALLYTPKVLIIRDDWGNLLAQPTSCAVITCPAPNRRAVTDKSASAHDLKRADTAIQTRIAMILQTLASKGHDTAILGAWGCGVFANNPGFVAQTFTKTLHAIGAPKYAHFAVLGLNNTDIGRAFQQGLTQNT